MNISEFQFRFLDIAEQIECTSKHSPLNLKETLNYWNILLSHLLELKDEETNSLKILRALEQLHQLLSIEEKNPSFSKNTTQTLTAWLSIEITLCSKNLSVSEKSPAKNNVSPLHWLTKANELLELINSLCIVPKSGQTPVWNYHIQDSSVASRNFSTSNSKNFSISGASFPPESETLHRY